MGMGAPTPNLAIQGCLPSSSHPPNPPCLLSIPPPGQPLSLRGGGGRQKDSGSLHLLERFYFSLFTD